MEKQQHDKKTPQEIAEIIAEYGEDLNKQLFPHAHGLDEEPAEPAVIIL